jgi:hypothetical protein
MQTSVRVSGRRLQSGPRHGRLSYLTGRLPRTDSSLFRHAPPGASSRGVHQPAMGTRASADPGTWRTDYGSRWMVQRCHRLRRRGVAVIATVMANRDVTACHGQRIVAGRMPSLNNRRPEPSTSRKVIRRKRSTSSWCNSVWSSLLLPQVCSSSPGSSFSPCTAAKTWPVTRPAVSGCSPRQMASASLSELDPTYLGRCGDSWSIRLCQDRQGDEEDGRRPATAGTIWPSLLHVGSAPRSSLGRDTGS